MWVRLAFARLRQFGSLRTSWSTHPSSAPQSRVALQASVRAAPCQVQWPLPILHAHIFLPGLGWRLFRASPSPTRPAPAHWCRLAARGSTPLALSVVSSARRGDEVPTPNENVAVVPARVDPSGARVQLAGRALSRAAARRQFGVLVRTARVGLRVSGAVVLRVSSAVVLRVSSPAVLRVSGAVVWVGTLLGQTTWRPVCATGGRRRTQPAPAAGSVGQAREDGRLPRGLVRSCGVEGTPALPVCERRKKQPRTAPCSLSLNDAGRDGGSDGDSCHPKTRDEHPANTDWTDASQVDRACLSLCLRVCFQFTAYVRLAGPCRFPARRL